MSALWLVDICVSSIADVCFLVGRIFWFHLYLMSLYLFLQILASVILDMIIPSRERNLVDKKEKGMKNKFYMKNLQKAGKRKKDEDIQHPDSLLKGWNRKEIIVMSAKNIF